MLVLDTNAVIYLQSGRLAAPLEQGEYGISIITEIELLSFPGLSQHDEELLKLFFRGIAMLPLNERVKEKAVALRRKHRIKIPDAIICATAIAHNALLLTNDRQLLNIAEVQTVPLLLTLPAGQP